MKIAFSIIVSFFSLLTFAQGDRFGKANDHYNEGQYKEAIALYLEILQGDSHSAALYYNLGNAYYKLNQVAPSIYYYEKALLLAPDDEDIRNNLLFAQKMTIDAIEIIPQTAMSRLAEKVVGRFSYHIWAMLSIVCMILFVMGFLWYYFSVRGHKKRLFFAVSAVFLMLSILSFGAAYYNYDHYINERPAIIFEKEISVMSEPNDRSEPVFVLHEGTKVNVQDALGDWKKIRLTDGKTGWVLAETLKEVKDF